MYDYVIVGAGFFGSVFAHEASKNGKKCLVLEKRQHIGGNAYTKNIEGVNVHLYGPHIFHTSSDKIWGYVNNLVEFKQFIYSPVARYHDEFYSLPFNMWTFHQLWGVKTPAAALQRIEETRVHYANPKNLEEFALSKLGKDIYEKLICGYTEKHWMKHPSELPSFIIKRLPFRLTFDANYYNDKFCGIPIGGYTKIFDKLLDGIPVEFGVDFFSDREYFESIATKIIYTGKLDEFFGYEYGDLEYRALKFDHKIHNTENFQGVVTINHTSIDVPYTRTIEHKFFDGIKSKKTVVTTETPVEYTRSKTPYYPINDKQNNRLFKLYKSKANKLSNYVFGGRLADYKYYDMDQVIASSLKRVSMELE
jgi:UDP-galactopyranose mutase